MQLQLPSAVLLTTSSQEPLGGASALTCLTWQGDRMNIYLYFDSTGQLCWKDSTPAVFAEQESLDSVLWLAKRQWHRWFP